MQPFNSAERACFERLQREVFSDASFTLSVGPYRGCVQNSCDFEVFVPNAKRNVKIELKSSSSQGRQLNFEAAKTHAGKRKVFWQAACHSDAILYVRMDAEMLMYLVPLRGSSTSKYTDILSRRTVKDLNTFKDIAEPLNAASLAVALASLALTLPEHPPCPEDVPEDRRSEEDVPVEVKRTGVRTRDQTQKEERRLNLFKKYEDIKGTKPKRSAPY